VGGDYEVVASGDGVVGFLENRDTSSTKFSVADGQLSFIRQGIFRFFATAALTVSRGLMPSVVLVNSDSPGTSDGLHDITQLHKSDVAGSSVEFGTPGQIPVSSGFDSITLVRSAGLEGSESTGQSGQFETSVKLKESAGFNSAGFESVKLIGSGALETSESIEQSGQFGTSAELRESSVFESARFDSAGFESVKLIRSDALGTSESLEQSGQFGTSAELRESSGFESAAFDSARLDGSPGRWNSGQFETSAKLMESAAPPSRCETLPASTVCESFLFQGSFLLDQTDALSISFKFPESGTFTPIPPPTSIPPEGDGGKGGAILSAALGGGAGAISIAGIVPWVVKMLRKMGGNAAAPESDYSWGDSENIEFSDPD
jgi:hypothetical protein